MTRDAGSPLAPPNSAQSPESTSQSALLDFASDVLLLVDGNGSITYANARLREVFQYEPAEVHGQLATQLIGNAAQLGAPTDYASLPPFRPTGEQSLAHLQRRDGETFPAEVRTRLIRAGTSTCTAVAIRELATKTSGPVRGELPKVEAVGRLAGAIAHDFNNILMAITSFADAAYQSARSGSPVRAHLEEVLAATERARLLTKKLLDFAKRRPVDPISVDINAVVRSTERMIDVLMSKTVHVERLLSPHVGLVRVDPGGMEQVIVNLCVNACDAMPAGGTLTLQTDSAEVTPEGASGFGEGAAPGMYVVLRVTDTGTGMTEDVQRRVFEPFFSTKPTTTGTGLGLATCYGLVSQAGGFIHIDSQLGRGTTVEVYLPQAAPRPPMLESGPVAGTVLLVEADQTVRSIATRELARAGFNAIAASGWLDALDAVRDQNGQVDVLVTDLAIPGTDGFELASRIRRLCPTVRVLFMSQVDASTLNAKGLRAQEHELLRKPFGVAELLEKIRELRASSADPPTDRS